LFIKISSHCLLEFLDIFDLSFESFKLFEGFKSFFFSNLSACCILVSVVGFELELIIGFLFPISLSDEIIHLCSFFGRLFSQGPQLELEHHSCPFERRPLLLLTFGFEDPSWLIPIS